MCASRRRMAGRWSRWHDGSAPAGRSCAGPPPKNVSKAPLFVRMVGLSGGGSSAFWGWLDQFRFGTAPRDPRCASRQPIRNPYRRSPRAPRHTHLRASNFAMSAETGEMFPSQHDPAGTTLELAISPAGHIYLESLAGQADLPEASVAKRIRKTFEGAAPAGLLHWAQWNSPVRCRPPSPSGVRSRNCSWHAGARYRTWPTSGRPSSCPLPAMNLAQLASAAPPLTGIEYLDGAALETLWDQMLSAARAEIAALGRRCPRVAQEQAPELEPRRPRVLSPGREQE